METIKKVFDVSRDGWKSGFLVAIVLVLVVLLVIRRSEHASNRDPMAEKLILASQLSDPLDSAMMLDSVERFGRGDESDTPYQTHNLKPHHDFENLQDGSQLIDLLYA